MRRFELLMVLSVCCLSGCRDSSSQVRDSRGDVDLSLGGEPMRLRSDPVTQRADSLVRAGRSWRATALLAPSLSSPASAPPEVRLAGARAAAGWEGWSEVDRLLRSAPWLDRQFGGEGRELLVRSALERGKDALADARLALDDARDDASRITRRVFLARAFDRANKRDSAEIHYRAAADRLPRIADWLYLRAAGVTDDSADRAKLFARVKGAVARARILATDAQARERSGDIDGAARAFRQGNAPGSAFRVEALDARDERSRAALADRIVVFLGGSADGADVRQAIEVLDGLGAHGPGQELIIARAAGNAGVNTRAVTGFARAAAAGPLSTDDRMRYANSLARLGRSSEAARMYATITDAPALVPAAAYQRARMLMLAGDGGGARTALRQVATQYPGTRDAAAPALLLLADLQVDDDNIAGASASLKELIRGQPGAPQIQLARFRSGVIDFGSSPAAAAVAFDSLAALPVGDETTAARYWAGRAYEKAGRRSDAEDRWRAVIKSDPVSYYAMLASQRLQSPGWSPPGGADTVKHARDVDSAVARILALQRLGMDVETRFEVNALADRAERQPSDAPAAAQALLDVGEPARAITVALKAIARGDASRALYRIAFPVVHEDGLVEESQRNGLDPALIAGLVRQESSWNPHALSPANARGLMQLLPGVGASIAASRKYPLWTPALLFDPDVSLELGTAHLSSSLRRDTPVPRALAAYNAGTARVNRWVQRPGASDPELFAEWIPYTETRDYVRIVQRNAAMYRALYGMK